VRRYFHQALWCLAWCAVLTSALAQEEKIPPLRPPRPELRPSFWELHRWQMVLAVAVVLAAVGVWTRWRGRPKPVITIPPETVARNLLERLRSRPENLTVAAEVSRIVRRYVTAAFNLPPDELTAAELRRALEKSQVSPDLVSAISDFLQRCDEWKFAPVEATPPLGGVVTGACELIDKTEASRKQAVPVQQPQSVT